MQHAQQALSAFHAAIQLTIRHLFLCPQMSDGHRRQMDVFGLNPRKVVGEYSQQFEEGFLEHFKRA